MILTVTMNPSVDIGYTLDRLITDGVNRVGDTAKSAGGKGLNVSRVLRQLDEQVAATGVLGGSLGDFIRNQIKLLGIKDLFVEIEGETRNCVAIIHEGKQTEILESGPVILQNEAELFIEKFSCDVKKAKVVTISGSLPKGLQDDFYEKLIDIANENGTAVLLDTKGDLLSHTLKSGRKVHLIKPNHEELGDMIGANLKNDADVIAALQSTELFADIPWVVVTMGAKGAIVKRGNALYKVNAPKITAKNPVGSGDSVIAGFAAGLSKGLGDEELIKFGLSMGVLNAMEEKTGFVNTENIGWCMAEMTVEKL